MKLVDSRRLLGAAAVAFGLFGLASAAQARTDVFLSIGLPGVVVAPAPVVVAPQPVYVQPQPVYHVQEGGWRHRHWREHRGERRWY